MKDYSDHRITELLSLAGRVALVTGGARGIGRQIASRLAEAGAHVIIADLSEADANGCAGELGKQFGTPCAGIAADVADEKSVQRLFRLADDLFGQLDILVNNAGVSPPGRPTTDTALEYWDRIQAVNLRGAFLCAREAAIRMKAAGSGGVIVNIASTAGFLGTAGLGSYVASKHGIIGLTKVLALELGPDNIRVVGVAPTLTRTNMLLDTGNSDQVIASVAPRVPLGRIAVPDDIARVVLFCVSDMAAFVTGTTIPADGGTLSGMSGNSAFLPPKPQLSHEAS